MTTMLMNLSCGSTTADVNVHSSISKLTKTPSKFSKNRTGYIPLDASRHSVFHFWKGLQEKTQWNGFENYRFLAYTLFLYTFTNTKMYENF